MIDVIGSVYSAAFLRRLVDVRLTDVVIILERSARCSDKCKPDKGKRLYPLHPPSSATPVLASAHLFS